MFASPEVLLEHGSSFSRAMIVRSRKATPGVFVCVLHVHAVCMLVCGGVIGGGKALSENDLSG